MITITGREANVKKAADKIQEIQSQMANIVSQVSLLLLSKYLYSNFLSPIVRFQLLFTASRSRRDRFFYRR